MTDREALEFLAEKLGNKSRLAEALCITPQVLSNWLGERGISYQQRAAIWAMVNDHGGNLSREWLIARKSEAA